jgi:hypothetical protein
MGVTNYFLSPARERIMLRELRSGFHPHLASPLEGEAIKLIYAMKS